MAETYKYFVQTFDDLYEKITYQTDVDQDGLIYARYHRYGYYFSDHYEDDPALCLAIRDKFFDEITHLIQDYNSSPVGGQFNVKLSPLFSFDKETLSFHRYNIGLAELLENIDENLPSIVEHKMNFAKVFSSLEAQRKIVKQFIRNSFSSNSKFCYALVLRFTSHVAAQVEKFNNTSKKSDFVFEEFQILETVDNKNSLLSEQEELNLLIEEKVLQVLKKLS